MSRPNNNINSFFSPTGELLADLRIGIDELYAGLVAKTDRKRKIDKNLAIERILPTLASPSLSLTPFVLSLSISAWLLHNEL